MLELEINISKRHFALKRPLIQLKTKISISRDEKKKK